MRNPFRLDPAAREDLRTLRRLIVQWGYAEDKTSQEFLAAYEEMRRCGVSVYVARKARDYRVSEIIAGLLMVLVFFLFFLTFRIQ